MVEIVRTGTELTAVGSLFRLTFDTEKGVLARLVFEGRDIINVGAVTGIGFTVRIDAVNMAPVFVTHTCLEKDGTADIRLTYEIKDGSLEHSPTRNYRVVQQFVVSRDGIERNLTIKRIATGDHTGPDLDRLRSATLSLNGLAITDVASAFVSAPMIRIVPGSPLGSMLDRPRYFPSATEPYHNQYDFCLSSPDSAPNCVTLDDGKNLHVSIVPVSPQCASLGRIFGDGKAVKLEHEFACSSWMDIGTQVHAARQFLLFRKGSWREALPDTGKLLATYFPPKTDVPSWLDNAIVYESDPHYEGGFKGLRAKVQAIRDVGANTIYVMPWHRGGYGTIDYYEPDPACGTIEELKETIAAAHAVRLRVLFDLLTNIINPSGTLATQHPEMFYRDEHGRIRAHATWGSLCLDPASPELRRYLTEYACWCVGELGADGFRVDADGHRGANWNCLPGMQPHQHSQAVFTLLEEVRREMRRIKSDAILMPENFGPIQASVGDTVCWGWLFTIDWAMEMLANGRLSGADFQRFIAEQIMTMPTGTRFAYYSHTHDSLAFLKRDVRGLLGQAFFAALAFLGSTIMYFGGGWGMAARPEPEEAEQYRRMFSLRTAHNGFSGYSVDFPVSPDKALCIYQRCGADGVFTVVTNFSGSARAMEIGGTMILSRTGGSVSSGNTLTVEPYDTVVVRA